MSLFLLARLTDEGFEQVADPGTFEDTLGHLKDEESVADLVILEFDEPSTPGTGTCPCIPLGSVA